MQKSILTRNYYKDYRVISMVVRKKKKVRKMRGTRSYGYGSHKKHRGGGSRGGRGKAGMHKHKWSYTVKYEPDHFGKRGFKRPKAVAKKLKTIGLRGLEKLAAESGKKKIDLTTLGYDKLLGSGRISTGLEVTAKSFSKKAAEKIEAAGGKVIIVGKAVEVEKAGSEEVQKSEEKVEEKTEEAKED
jgi:large subunit ribosomal protein L15